MKKEDVPQHQSSSLAGQRKPLYVVDEHGRYTTELSSGWDVEEVVLHQALEQFQQLAEAARLRVEAGLSSPLEYHMYARRMDLTVLAQSVGMFRWRVKRHLKPAVFCRLSAATLSRYAGALGLSVTTLQQVPASPQVSVPEHPIDE